MRDAANIASDYISLWNETDSARRARALAEGWDAAATYTDPVMRGAGASEIDALVAGVQARFPGYRFKLINQPNGHGEYVRFAWSLGPDGGEAPIEGSDVLVIKDGRIRQVIGFLDRVPQA